MFLNSLCTNEKNAFYSLAVHIVNADGILAENEKDLLDQFLGEMKLTEEQIKMLTVEESFDVFLKSSMIIKKQVFIELYALATCDSEFAKEEKKLISDYADHMGISNQDKDKLETCVIDLLQVYSRMNTLINE